MTAKHTHDPVCPLCTLKLDQSHPLMRQWFFAVKAKFKDAHVSWAFRGKEDQDQMVKDKRSQTPWPRSKHNFIENGIPSSKALDLFQLSTNRLAIYNYAWFERINIEFGASPVPIRWGGTFKTLGDYCHFEIS